MGAGSGGFMEASREMARMQREMRRYMAERARRRAERRDKLKFGTAVPTRKRVPFPCFSMCSDCHLLVRKVSGPCPSCGENTWLDLADQNSADMLRDEESAERFRSPMWAKLAVGGIGAAAFGVGGLVIDPLVWLGAFAGVPFFYIFSLRPITWLLLKLRQNKPYRWRLPVPLPANDAASERVEGVAEATGEELTAPFSGEKCLAYVACVLFDTPGDARPPEWVLEEVDSVDFSVAGRPVKAGRVLLKAMPEPVVEVGNPDFNLERFLRERGLFHYDGEFELFEARVDAGARVSVSLYREPHTAVVGSAQQ